MLAVLAAGILSIGVVVLLWQSKKESRPGADDVEGGDRERRVLGSFAGSQRDGDGVVGDDGLGGRGAEVHRSVRGSSRSNSTLGGGEGQISAQGSTRSSSISSGNSSSRGNGDVADGAADCDNNSTSSSSYVSAVEYRELSPVGIKSVHLSRSTTSSSGPTGPHIIFNPTSSLDPRYTPSSSGPSQTAIDPFAPQLPNPIAASAGSVKAVEPNRLQEIRELDNYRPTPSRHSPLSGRSGNNIAPVLVLELVPTGESVRGTTGPEEPTGQVYVPWTTGSLQERLLGKHPARWG